VAWAIVICAPTVRSGVSVWRGFELAAVCDPRREAAEHAAEVVAELLGSRPAVFASAMS
jgi:hypothetical protein